MRTDKLDLCFDHLKDEVRSIIKNNYHGSIDIKLNIVSDNIVGANVSSSKSIKFSFSEK